MSKEELEKIYDLVNNVSIVPTEYMTLDELKMYVKGYEDAKYSFMDCVDKVFRECQGSKGGAE